MIDTDKYKGHTPGPWLNHNPDDPLAHRHDQCDFMVGTYEKGKTGHEYFKLIADWAGCVDCLPDANSIIAEYPDWANARLIADAPLLLEEVKRLRDGIRGILSDDITELIRDVPEDEWNFEQQALVRMKEMIEVLTDGAY